MPRENGRSHESNSCIISHFPILWRFLECVFTGPIRICGENIEKTFYIIQPQNGFKLFAELRHILLSCFAFACFVGLVLQANSYFWYDFEFKYLVNLAYLP